MKSIGSLVTLLVSIALIVLAFLLDSPQSLIKGQYEIIIAPDILLTDYIAVGGIGAAFLNAGLMGLINTLLLYMLKIPMNGLAMASIYTVIGFSFIGKNLFNFWPIYLGGLIYSKLKDIKFNSIFIVLMFATTLSPVVSQIAFGINLSPPIAIPLGIIMGIIIGFTIVPLSEQVVKFHDGYNLYNIGFAGGLLGTLIASLMRGTGIIFNIQNILSYEHSSFICLMLIILFGIFIIIGIYKDDNSLTDYISIFSYKGRTPTDFIKLKGEAVTYLNMGLMGIICIIYVFLLNGVFNGPVMAGIFTVVGFSAFGKHPKNAVPILVGVMLSAYFNIWESSSTSVIIAGLFGTTLAPVAGKYGFTAGIIAGVLHLAISMNVGVVHGGVNLYNNGFAGGIVAGIIVPILNMIQKERNKRNNRALLKSR